MRLRSCSISACIAVAGVAFAMAGCGGGGSGFTEDEIAEILDIRFEGADYLYATPEGNCIIVRFLTSSDEIEAADTGDVSEAVATTPEGDAGVVFGGITSVDPNECASYAEEDLVGLGR